MIEIKQLSKRFDNFTAVNNLSFKVSEGEVLGFLGPNGAGKSTTMKIITGFLAPSEGSVSVGGYDIGSEPLQAKSLIGYLPEGAPSYGDMTTLEFLNFIGQVRGFRGNELASRVQKVVDEVDLHSVQDQVIETLSKGYKRRVGLAQAIMHNPKVLILDEPTDGLDPNQKHHVRELIKNLARDKIVIISTHILEEVSAVCSRAIIIARGEIVADGTPAELEAKSRYHNAVTLRFSASCDCVPALEQIRNVSSVEADPELDHCFTVLSKGSGTIYGDVAALVQEKGWPVEELHVNRGLLEDVFRSVTAPAERQAEAA